MQIQNASDDLTPLKYLTESVMEAVQEHEINLPALVYLLSATVNIFERRRVDSTVTEVELYMSVYKQKLNNS